MGKWEMVRLGDVCEKGSSNITQKDLETNFGDYPIFGAAGLIKYVNFYKQLDAYIAIVKDGAGIGRTTLMPAKSSVTGTMQYILPKKIVNLKYLYFAITHMNLAKFFTGTTIPHIYFKDYRKEQLPRPPLDEQKRIAKNLDLASDIVKGYKEQLAELDKLVQSVFYEMFGDPVTNEKGWDIKYIDELYKIIDGDRGTNYPKQEDFSNEEYCLFLNAGNVTKKGFVFENVQFITKSKDGLLRKGKLQRDDIILTTRGTVGNLAHYTENIPFDNIRINSGMVILRKFTEIEHNYFLAYFSNPLIYTSLMSGSAQPQLPITNMRKAKVLYPPLPLQTRFTAIVTAIETQKAQVQQALTEAKNLFSSLMQEYFE